MKLRPEVKDAMRALGITKLRKHQAKVINRILDHKDTMLIAATSSGKSLCGIIPAVIRHDKLTLIIEPLTVLMHDQVNKLCELGIRAAYIDSTQSKEQQQLVYQQLKAGNITLLYVSPERLAVLPDWVIDQLWLLVVDECHCVSAWGNSFRADYLEIGDFVERVRSRPTILAMTASAPPEDWEQIAQLLGMKNGKVLQQDLYRSNLHFLKCLAPSRQEQLRLTRKYLRKYHAHTTIIFCSTTDAVKAVAKELDKDYSGDVAMYHGRDKRSEKQLLAGEEHIIVATNALAMGVDLHNVDLVILFNMPASVSELYQMTGRAGREGPSAHCVLIYNPKDYQTRYFLLQNIPEKEARRKELHRLDRLKEICEDEHRCLTNLILAELGQERDTVCRYCSTCQRGKRGTGR